MLRSVLMLIEFEYLYGFNYIPAFLTYCVLIRYIFKFHYNLLCFQVVGKMEYWILACICTVYTHMHTFPGLFQLLAGCEFKNMCPKLVRVAHSCSTDFLPPSSDTPFNTDANDRIGWFWIGWFLDFGNSSPVLQALKCPTWRQILDLKVY